MLSRCPEHQRGAPVTFHVSPPLRDMEALIDQLVRYVAVLAQANHDATRAEDRHAYIAHLAAAAELFLAAYQRDLVKLRDVIASPKVPMRPKGRNYATHASRSY